MTTLELTADLLTGIQDIDNQHASIINWTKDLTSPVTEGSPDLARKVLKGMLDYVKYHFEAEELAMEISIFPDIEKHVNQHQRLNRELVELASRTEKGDRPDSALLAELQYFLLDWLKYHILEWDQPLAAHIKASGLEGY